MFKRLFSILTALMLCSNMFCAAAYADTSGRYRASFNETAAYEFTDQGSIINVDAALMLVDLGVIGGYPDGGFRPKATVSRAEVCKMVTLALCPSDLEDLEAQSGDWSSGDQDFGISASSFTDTAGHWAEREIDWCYFRGIVSGYEDGSFRPDQEITAVELAKMLLVAAGWPADRYTGEFWQDAVDLDASEQGLYRAYVDITSARLNRDNAALLLYNALQSPMVEFWDNGLPSFYLDELMNPMSMLEYVWDLKKYSEAVMANEYADLENGGRLDKGFTRIAHHREFYVSTDLSFLGRRVDIYVDGEGRVYGNPVPDIEELYYFVYGDQFDGFMHINGLSVDEDTQYYLNYNASAPMRNFEENEEITVIDWERDGHVDILLVTRYDFYTVTSVDAGGYHLQGGPDSYIRLSEIEAQDGSIKAGSAVKIVIIAGQYFIAAVG